MGGGGTHGHIDRCVLTMLKFKLCYLPSQARVKPYTLACMNAERAVLWIEITSHLLWEARPRGATSDIPKVDLSMILKLRDESVIQDWLDVHGVVCADRKFSRHFSILCVQSVYTTKWNM